MSHNRTFYLISTIEASAEGQAFMEMLKRDTMRKLYEQHQHRSLEEVVAIIGQMNQVNADMGNRFTCSPLFDGVAFIQISHKACDDPWVLLPERADRAHLPPIIRVGMKINGVVACKAPPSITDLWLATPPLRGSTLIAPGAFINTNFPECANCGRLRLGMQHCSACGLVRYCSSACQEAHWKHFHKKICRWAKKAINCEFTDNGDILQQ